MDNINIQYMNNINNQDRYMDNQDKDMVDQFMGTMFRVNY